MPGGARKRSVARPRAPGAALQKRPKAPREAAAGEGDGGADGLGASSAPGVRDSIPCAGPSLPAQSSRLLFFSTPAGNQQEVRGPAQRVCNKVGGRAAFALMWEGGGRLARLAELQSGPRSARCAPLISPGRSALSAAARLSRARRSPGGLSADGPRGDRARHRRGARVTAPARAVAPLRRLRTWRAHEPASPPGHAARE